MLLDCCTKLVDLLKETAMEERGRTVAECREGWYVNRGDQVQGWWILN